MGCPRGPGNAASQSRRIHSLMDGRSRGPAEPSIKYVRVASYKNGASVIRARIWPSSRHNNRGKKILFNALA